jgi:hypothetical protein
MPSELEDYKDSGVPPLIESQWSCSKKIIYVGKNNIYRSTHEKIANQDANAASDVRIIKRCLIES